MGIEGIEGTPSRMEKEGLAERVMLEMPPMEGATLYGCLIAAVWEKNDRRAAVTVLIAPDERGEAVMEIVTDALTSDRGEWRYFDAPDP